MERINLSEIACPVCSELFLNSRRICHYCHKVIWNIKDHYKKKKRKENKI